MKTLRAALFLLFAPALFAQTQTYNYFPPPGYNCSAGPPAQIPFSSTANKLLCSSLISWDTSNGVLNIGSSSAPGTFSVGQLVPMTVSGTVLHTPGVSINSNIVQGNIEAHSFAPIASNGSTFYGVRARGTISSPTAVQNGDNVLTLAGAGFDGTNYDWAAHIHFLVDGTPGTDVLPGAIDFQTTPSASNTPVSVLKLDHSGGYTVNGSIGTAGQAIITGGAGAPAAYGTLTVPGGGTGVTTLAAHTLLLGEGTSPVSGVAAMAANTLLQGQGVTSDPAAVSVNNCGDGSHALSYSTSTHAFGCQAISTLSTPVTVANGGTGVATLTSHGVLLGEGVSNVSAVAAMAADTLLQGQGASADPAAVTVNDCGDSTHALSYSTSTHTFGCQAVGGGSTPVLDLAHGGGNVTTPSNTGWTLEANGGTFTETTGANGQLIFNAGFSGAPFPFGYRKTYGGGNFDVIAYVTDPTQAGFGFFVRDSATGNITTIGAGSNSLAAPDLLNFTSAAGTSIGTWTFSSSVGAYSNNSPPQLSYNTTNGWYRFTRVTNTYQIYSSVDGANWVALSSSGFSTTFAASPNQFGFYFNVNGATLNAVFTIWSLSGI